MTAFVGLGPLVRLILRRDRWLLPVWVALPAILVGFTAAAFADFYPTEAARRQFATLVETNPGFTAFLGPLHGSSIGALTFWRTVIIGVVLAGLPALFTVIRHTRAEEQAGRRELIGSTVVGRQAPLTAALLVVAGYTIIMGAGVAAALVAAGLPDGGAAVAGASWTGFALFCAALGAVAAQIVENPRTARGIGGGVLAVAYVFRVTGDTAGGALAWMSRVSPIGWMHATRPFAADRWGVLALFALAVVAMTGSAFALSSRRDLDAGIFASRPGPSSAAPGLRSPLGLSLRLHRGAFVGWTAGIALFGVIVGGLGPSMVDVLDDNPQLREIFERLGGEGAFIDIFISAGLGTLGLLAAAYAVQAALRLRSEEEAGHAEMILGTPVTRPRLAASHVVIAGGGPALAMIIGGLVAGVTYGIVTGDIAGEATRLGAASAAHIPSILVMGGITIALFGVAPRAAAVAWGAMIGFIVLGQLGPVIGVDQWLMNLSPFTHTPTVPAGSLRTAPLAWMTAAAIAMAAAGVAGFQRRDITGS